MCQELLEEEEAQEQKRAQKRLKRKKKKNKNKDEEAQNADPDKENCMVCCQVSHVVDGTCLLGYDPSKFISTSEVVDQRS